VNQLVALMATTDPTGKENSVRQRPVRPVVNMEENACTLHFKKCLYLHIYQEEYFECDQILVTDNIGCCHPSETLFKIESNKSVVVINSETNFPFYLKKLNY
jgi:hypothetical protein